tara:strand:- start:908 stop:1084 length:177 start_codon:yes stop_codon:yes gene_type:complete
MPVVSGGYKMRQTESNLFGMQSLMILSKFELRILISDLQIASYFLSTYEFSESKHLTF